MSTQELLQERAIALGRQAEILDTAQAENRNLTPEEEAEFTKADTFCAIANAEISRREREQEAGDLDAPFGKKFRPHAIGVDYSRNNRKLDDGGFQSLGEFIDAVRFGDPKGRLRHLEHGPSGGVAVPEAFRAQILPGRVMAEWTMDTGSQGGFAVPAQTWDGDPLMIQPEGAIVRPRAAVIPAGDPPDAPISIPAFHQGADGVLGGVQVFWIGEGALKPETSGQLEEVVLQPHEVAAHTVVSDKLLRNWAAASRFISALLRRAVTHTEDVVFLRGDGVGKPIGLLNSPALLAVNRAVANQISFADVTAMLAKLPSESMSRAVWVAHQSTLPQLTGLKDEAGNAIFIAGDASKALPSTLAGLPLIFTGKTNPLGQKGDLLLVDFSYYLVKDGSGPFVAASEHVYFRENKTVIKVFWNVDGKGWVKEPLLLDDGVTRVSPYVALDVPAA